MKSSLLLIVLCLALFSCSKKKGDTPGNLNPWDGRYSIEGTMVDVTDATYTHPGPSEYFMETTSPTQIKVYSKVLGLYAHLIKVGINLSFYGNFGLIVNWDPATNKITSVTNVSGQPSVNGRSAVLDPSGVNAWDPVTKNIKIKYWMDEVGVAGHRTSFDETWVYIGAR